MIKGKELKHTTTKNIINYKERLQERKGKKRTQNDQKRGNKMVKVCPYTSIITQI